MARRLWEASSELKSNANITAFMQAVNERHELNLTTYPELYQWSIDHIAEFWAQVWDYAGTISTKPYDSVVDDPYRMPGTKWFSGARMNFAENLLRRRDEHTAFVFRGEDQVTERMTYADLYATVAGLTKSLRAMGVGPGDRVVGYMPNMIETAAAMLATTAVGATWASCATDIGPDAAADRLGQVEPVILFTVDEYLYRGKRFDVIPRAAALAARIPSLRKVVVASYAKTGTPDVSRIPNAVRWEDFSQPDAGHDIDFEQLPADHPVYIMFSSGTTGKPKCMVQGAAGVLLNHYVEVVLLTDLKPQDVITYITTCSWMMWNWLLSSLMTGATILLYDGNPMYPDTGAMWRLVDEEKVSIFGTSATYLNYVKTHGLVPKDEFDLSSLREISQTGSVLSAEGWEWVHDSVKADLHFNSIAGGTDFNGAFLGGNLLMPVYAGQMQGWTLGKKCAAYGPEGMPVVDRQGELVCEAAVPSMPLYFWNDPDDARYRAAYFEMYPGKWRHGDFIQVHSDTGGVTMYGRSDSTLNPSGVRIGTAEIYTQMERLDGIADSLAIGQQWQGDERVILFVKLAPGATLTEELRTQIRQTLLRNASPRHVPTKIIAVTDIPYTLNMKKVESAVTNIIHGKPVLNRDALSNPESLEHYRDIPELKT
ncbi:MAG: acetoacetate--CoA ligase [Dehalococcoidia bacterium]|nr:acetoacetate--CoA ligase [Dehalococcoidia bacterium]